MKNNFWITGMTTWGNEENLRGIIEPIKHHFDGLCWVFNSDTQDDNTCLDKGHQYLHKVINDYVYEGKKGGDVITSKWVNRNDHNRNKTLFEGPMKYSDYFLIIDTLERIKPEFVDFLKKLAIDNPEIDGFLLEGKRLFFKMSESLHFSGNPHEGIRGAKRCANLTIKEFPQIEDWWENLRPKVRDRFHWVDAYMKYYLFPDSNHLALGYEHDKNFIIKRYQLRDKFIIKLIELDVDVNESGLRRYVSDEGLGELIEFFNQEKILNDWYRFNFLDDKSVIDKHDVELIKEIKLKS